MHLTRGSAALAPLKSRSFGPFLGDARKGHTSPCHDKENGFPPVTISSLRASSVPDFQAISFITLKNSISLPKKQKSCFTFISHCGSMYVVKIGINSIFLVKIQVLAVFYHSSLPFSTFFVFFAIRRNCDPGRNNRTVRDPCPVKNPIYGGYIQNGSKSSVCGDRSA